MESIELNSGGHFVKIQPLERDGRWLGFGAVEIDGEPLRDAELPWQVRIDTPDGFLYTNLLIDRMEYGDGGAAHLHLRAIGIDWGRQIYRDDYQMSLASPAPQTEPVEDRVVISFTPIELSLGDHDWHGFSYQVSFTSDTRQVHRIVSYESWELGGKVDGNTVLHRGQCNMPVYRGATDSRFTTYCLKTLEQYGTPQGISYQQGARGGLLQPFDFQHNDDTAVLAYWPEYDSVHSFVDSPEGCPQLRTVDEYRMPLCSEVSTSPKHVLMTKGDFPEHAARNLWWRTHEHIVSAVQKKFDVKPSISRPEIDQTQRSKSEDGRLYVEVDGEWVESREMLYALADRELPKMASSGIRRLFPVNVHETDVTMLGMKRKLDDGLQGDLHCASVCGTHRFFPSEFWGGIKAWRYLADKAHELGMEVGAWFAPHFSPRASIFKEHPDWLMTGVDTRPWGGGYGFHTIVTADWHTGVYQWALDDIRRWSEEGGIDYLFTDSWPNLALLPQNFAADMRDNTKPLARLYHDLQQVGVRMHLFEGISPFGISRIGVKDLRGDLLDEDKGVAGQNDLGWWIGAEDMAYDITMLTVPRKRDEAQLRQLQFRMMANRGVMLFKRDSMTQSSNVMSSGKAMSPYTLPDWEIELNHIYEQALPHMKRRTILPDGLGVHWTDGQTNVLWAYRDGEFDVADDASVEQLQGTQLQLVAHRSPVSVKAGCVYRIR